MSPAHAASCAGSRQQSRDMCTCARADQPSSSLCIQELIPLTKDSRTGVFQVTCSLPVSCTMPPTSLSHLQLFLAAVCGAAGQGVASLLTPSTSDCSQASRVWTPRRLLHAHGPFRSLCICRLGPSTLTAAVAPVLLAPRSVSPAEGALPGCSQASRRTSSWWTGAGC